MRMDCLKIFCVFVLFTQGHGWTLRMNYHTEKVSSLRSPVIDTEIKTTRIFPLQFFYPYFPEKIDNTVGNGKNGEYANDTEKLNFELQNNTESDSEIVHPTEKDGETNEDHTEQNDESGSDEDDSSSSEESNSSSGEDDFDSDELFHQYTTTESLQLPEGDSDEKSGGFFQNMEIDESFFSDMLAGLDFMETANHFLEIIFNDDDETTTTTQAELSILTERDSSYLSTTNPLSFVLRIPSYTQSPMTVSTESVKIWGKSPDLNVIEDSTGERKLSNESQVDGGVSVLEIFYPHTGIEIKSFAAGTTLTLVLCGILILLWRLTKQRGGKIIQTQSQLPPTVYDVTK